MTGPKGNSEFCFPKTLNVPLGFASGNIEVEGKLLIIIIIIIIINRLLRRVRKCHDLNAVFAFVFATFPPSLFYVIAND